VAATFLLSRPVAPLARGALPRAVGPRAWGLIVAAVGAEPRDECAAGCLAEVTAALLLWLGVFFPWTSSLGPTAVRQREDEAELLPWRERRAADTPAMLPPAAAVGCVPPSWRHTPHHGGTPRIMAAHPASSRHTPHHCGTPSIIRAHPASSGHTPHHPGTPRIMAAQPLCRDDISVLR
jgi:hypothetical protein